MKELDIAMLCGGCPNWQVDGSCPDVPADFQERRAAELAEANVIRPGRDPKFYCQTRAVVMRSPVDECLFKIGVKLVIHDPVNNIRLFGREYDK